MRPTEPGMEICREDSFVLQASTCPPGKGSSVSLCGIDLLSARLVSGKVVNKAICWDLECHHADCCENCADSDRSLRMRCMDEVVIVPGVTARTGRYDLFTRHVHSHKRCERGGT